MVNEYTSAAWKPSSPGYGFEDFSKYLDLLPADLWAQLGAINPSDEMVSRALFDALKQYSSSGQLFNPEQADLYSGLRTYFEGPPYLDTQAGAAPEGDWRFYRGVPGPGAPPVANLPMGTQWMPFEGTFQQYGGPTAEQWERAMPETPLAIAMSEWFKRYPEYSHLESAIMGATEPGQLDWARAQGIPIPDYLERSMGRNQAYDEAYKPGTPQPAWETLPEEAIYQSNRKRTEALNRMINAGIPFEQASSILTLGGLAAPSIPVESDPWRRYRTYRGVWGNPNYIDVPDTNSLEYTYGAVAPQLRIEPGTPAPYTESWRPKERQLW